MEDEAFAITTGEVPSDEKKTDDEANANDDAKKDVDDAPDPHAGDATAEASDKKEVDDIKADASQTAAKSTRSYGKMDERARRKREQREDTILRRVVKTQHLIHLACSEKGGLDPQVLEERIIQLSVTARRYILMLRDEKEKARDAEYYEREGESYSISLQEHKEWCESQGAAGNAISEATNPEPTPAAPALPVSSSLEAPEPESDLETEPILGNERTPLREISEATTPESAAAPPVPPVSSPLEAPEPEPESDLETEPDPPTHLELAIQTDDEFEAEIEIALGCSELGEGALHHFIAGKLDPFTPFLVIVCSVLGLRGLAVARRFTPGDIISAASRYAGLTLAKGKVAAIAKQVVSLRTTGKVSTNYSVIDNTQPVSDALNQAAEAEQVVANVDEEIARLLSLPLAVAAHSAAEKCGKSWLNIAKSNRDCITQNFVVSSIVVFFKTLMQVTFDEWEQRCRKRNEHNLFRTFRKFCERIYGGPVGNLSLALVVTKVLVEASFKQLSDEERTTEATLSKRLREDISSVEFVDEVQVAESGPLLLSKPNEAWVPNMLSAPIRNPHFGGKDRNGSKCYSKRRRIASKHIFYALRSRRLAEVMVPNGFPKDNVFNFSLSILCTTPTEIDRKKYNFLMSDPAIIQTEIPSILEEDGKVNSMLKSFGTKMNSFLDNYEFVDIAPDLREGTTAALDVVSFYLDSAFGVQHDDEGAEEASEGGEGVPSVQI